MNENSVTDKIIHSDTFTTPVFKSAISGILLYLINLLFEAGLSAAQIQKKKKKSNLLSKNLHILKEL